jgi:integrase
MKSPVVRLKLRVRLPDGSRPYLDPVFTGNHKLKPGYAMLDGKPVHFPDSVYHLRYMKGARRVWEAVGSDAQFALIAKMKKEKANDAIAAGLVIANDEPEPQPQTDLKSAIADYLDEIAAHKSTKTFAAYSLTLKLFQESVTKPNLENITRKDVLGFMTFLKAKRNAPRTIANRVANLKRFTGSLGFEWPLSRADKPRYTDKIVSAYSAEEIRSMLRVATGEESVLIQFFLYTGAREQEVQYATWRDVDFVAKTFTVSEKLDMGFTPKDKEEGAIPIPDSLVDLLEARRQRFPKSRLIFTNRKGEPNGHFLRVLKRVAKRAGLNCGHCYNRAGLCCATKPSARVSNCTDCARLSRPCTTKRAYPRGRFNGG